jgi:hypothetical protein
MLKDQRYSEGRIEELSKCKPRASEIDSKHNLLKENNIDYSHFASTVQLAPLCSSRQDDFRNFCLGDEIDKIYQKLE